LTPLVRSILAAGHNCIATSRNSDNCADVVTGNEAIGGTWAQLDVAAPDLDARLKDIIEKHGSVDVVVNNPGNLP
jgi:NAD(P)-dependent dehydrogenase (short-subunit alcohol dehydrogenase family)